MKTRVILLSLSLMGYALLEMQIIRLQRHVVKLEPSGLIASASNNKIVIHDMSELPITPKDTLPCTWEDKPHGPYPTYSICVKDGEDVGAVWKTTWDPHFVAFIGQAYCRSGDFETLEAAKQCVEKGLKK